MSLLALFLPACTSSSGGAGTEALTCSAAVSDVVATVVGVDWDAPEGSTSYVEFGETQDYGLTTPSSTDAAPHFDLVGVPADTDVYWHGVSETADGTSECTGLTRTGDAPGDLPDLRVTTDASGQDDAPYLVGAFFSGAGGSGGRTQLAAYRRDGALVWYYDGDEGATGMDLHYPLDGNGLLFNQFDGRMGGENGTIQRLSFAGDVLATWDAPYAHHMFCELPDGTLAYQRTDIRSYTSPDTGDTEDWVGDAIGEIDPEGRVTVVYSAWDDLTPARNDHMDVSIYDGLDWTHGNMLRYDADADAYLLSLGHADDILLVDRATDTVTTMWGVDGVAADPAFDYQHDVNVLDDGDVLMFMSDDSGAGAVEYADEDGTLVEVWRSTFGEKPFALGEARRLANGNTFVNGGAGGSLREETPDGEVVWEMTSGGRATVFGQFQLVKDLYTGG